MARKAAWPTILVMLTSELNRGGVTQTVRARIFCKFSCASIASLQALQALHNAPAGVGATLQRSIAAMASGSFARSVSDHEKWKAGGGASARLEPYHPVKSDKAERWLHKL
jgi:hypothetical protein